MSLPIVRVSPNGSDHPNDPGRLAYLDVQGPLATARVYLHGAHVALFQPTGQRPILFLSEKATFVAGKPIRGGVPVIFPWFGPHATDTQQPMHGLARLVEWAVESTHVRADGAVDWCSASTNSTCATGSSSAIRSSSP